MATLRRPSVAVESIWWAFVAGVGAGPVIGGIARLLFLWLGPILLPPTRPHPEWLTTNGIVLVITALAIGAVLIRAGGVVAIALYLAYELARLLIALPARQLFCKNSGANLSVIQGCDYMSLVTEHWVTWLGLLAGAAIGLVWLRSRDGENTLLRAAGAFSLVLVVATTPTSLIFLGRTDVQNLLLVLFSITNVIAGAFAGVLLARERLVAAVLLCVLIVAPGAAVAIPLAVSQSAPSKDLQSFALLWSGAFVPLLAAVSLITARGFVRQGDGGTFL